ncbi:MAG: ABC transporter ATP-binding protein [Gaiellaceae bacterium]
MSERQYSDLEIYRRLLLQARPYWPHIFAIFVLGLLATPLALLMPLALKIAVDSVLDDKPLPGFVAAVVPDSVEGSSLGLLLFAAGLFVAVTFLSQAQSVSSDLLSTYAGERLLLRFRAQLFRHGQRVSLAYHDLRGTSDSTYRIQYDAYSIQTIAVSGVIPFVTAGFMLVAMVYVTARIDAALAAIALVVAPLLLGMTWLYRRRLRHRHREVKKLESSAMSVVQEVLGAVRIVKAFGQEEREEERFVGRSGEGMRARLRVALIDGSFGLLIAMTTAFGTAAVLFVGVRRVQSGAITLGELLLVMGYLSQLYAPLYTIVKKITSLQSAFASAERALTLLDEEPEVFERPDARPLRRAHGEVAFQDVSFAYTDGRPVLRDVSFAVPPGTRVGIAGRTGAGKSTLASLLMRFYDPTEGTVLLDGEDIRRFKLADLRNQFAIVLQEPILFSTSVGENIAYARPEASFDEIVQAARAANAHDFIDALPEGYDTLVGERGMTLSGGERQRLSLARAFLKDAPMLILDEPTSSVDVQTEAAIIDAMDRLMEGRTTFMIAHRLGTLESCDVGLQVDDGRVVAQSAAATPIRRALASLWSR